MRRKLDGVAEQVKNDLAQAVGVAVKAVRNIAVKKTLQGNRFFQCTQAKNLYALINQ